ALYAADSDGNYKTESSTMTSSAVAEKLAATVDGYHYDEDGNICDSSDDVVLKALYKGTTGEDGRIDFENSDGAYYSLTELKELFGDHFYLREISVPSGYRNIADDVLLKFSDSLNLMTLANAKDSYTTGVWVTPSIRVRAPSVITANSEKVDYYTAGNEGSVNGTLFAVALKKENGSWYPVYGTDTYGYHVVSGSDMESIVTAAKNQASIDGGDLVFSYDSDSGDMQTYVNHLPGDISKYDFMLNNDSDAEYKVAYYYSTADSISGITSANTSEAGGYNDTVNDVTYNFSTAYASDIEYPDINNTLYVRKTDNEGTAMNGAVFGLYKVSEIEGTVYYVADDNSTLISLTPYTDDEDDSENDGTASVNGGSTGTYKINADGTISVSAGGSSYTINPVQTDTTASNSYVKANGIAEFDRLENGTYCVLEISVHDGYRTNKNPVRVLVDDSGVYANAGTQGDGITVARGTGALVATMHESASDDDINDTLSYITATMTENTSMSFDVDPGTFTSGTSVSLTHDADSVFGYSYDDDTDDTWPLRTEAGWVGMNVYQDTTALSGITGADYTNLNGTNIASLYAGGVFAIVADDPELINVNVEVKWEDYENINKLRPENVSVTLTGTANGSTVENKTKTITDDGTWTCKFEDLPYYKVYESFDSDGNPLGTEYVQISYSVTEAAVDHYSTSIDPESAVSTGDDLSFTVTNTLGVGSLTVSKTLDGDYADPTKEFTFTITLDNEDINGERGGITFTNGSATITLKGGESLTATLLPEGTGYTVTETGDHSGYEVSPAEATGTIVADETVTAAFTNTYSVTPATVTIQGIKTMTDGTTPEEGAYTFKLEGEDGTSLEAKNDGTGVFTFNDLTFNDTGTYTYTVSEVRGSDDEIVYDTNTYTVEVVVTDNGDGTISAVATVDGEAYTTTSISFVNSIAEEEPTPEPTPSNPDDETGTGESTPEGETGTEEGTPEGETGTEEGTPEGETGSEEGTPDSVTEPAGDVNGDISDAEPDGETSGADETSTGDAAYPGAYLLIIIACAAAAAVVFRRRRV
ncbi:MAG: Cna B-type domain-containing protein, partial [Clostridiales bacterium]|nr:Cna B-type domain-containing protein [Clostridiales bacterium]